MQTQSQQQAISSASPLIVTIAGPGSGKTSVLIQRIARLINDGVPANEIVALTYTNEAANNISARLGKGFFDQRVDLGFCGTLHSFLLRLIQQNSERLGYATDRLIVLDEQSATDLLARCASEVGCRASMRKLEQALASSICLPIEEITVKRYHQTMRRHGLISYDAILTEGLRLLSGPSITMPTYSHILIDEVQDCSDLDFAIYEALGYRIANRFFVGDSDQGIFGFRGGNVENILKLSGHSAVGVTAEVIKLEENFRSDIQICSAAQRLIEHNINLVAKVTRPVSTEPGKITVHSFKSSLQEMAAVLSAIQDSSGSCAVLVRNRKGNAGTGATVQDWAEALRAAGIPVATAKRQERPADWPLFKAALAVCVDPENDWSAYNLIRLKDGEDTAAQIRTEAAAVARSINETTFHLPDLTPTAYKPILARLGISSDCIALWDALIERMPNATGTELLAELAATEFTEEQAGHGVMVTTYHGAKGTEADNVFLPAFEDQLIPGRAKGEELEEARCIAYVAITRARHRLWISYCDERKPLFGGWRAEPVNPSRFISELS